MTKSLDTRREARLAARQAERIEDAGLDLPILVELLTLAEGELAEAAAKVAGLAERVLVRTSVGGMLLDPNANNVAAAATNLVIVVNALIADAEAVVKA